MRQLLLSSICGLLLTLSFGCDDTSKNEMSEEPSGGSSAGVEANAGEGSGDTGGEAGAEAEAGTDIPDEPVFGEIEATVNYSGELTGQLIIGVFPEVPPVSPPVSFKIINESVFPQTVTLDFVEEGSWYVFAFVDAEPINSQSPSETDPQGNSELIDVIEGMSNIVNFELVDQ